MERPVSALHLPRGPGAPLLGTQSRAAHPLPRTPVLPSQAQGRGDDPAVSLGAQWEPGGRQAGRARGDGLAERGGHSLRRAGNRRIPGGTAVSFWTAGRHLGTPTPAAPRCLPPGPWQRGAWQMGQRHALPIFFLFRVNATVSRRPGLTLSTCVLSMALVTLLVPGSGVRMRGSCRPQAYASVKDDRHRDIEGSELLPE